MTLDKGIDIFQLIVGTWGYRSIIFNKPHRKILFHMIFNNDGYQCIQEKLKDMSKPISLQNANLLQPHCKYYKI
ncbi:hypothetical protein EMIT0196MI5_90064 [Pseudomonas sp. IT-196MI5]